MCSRQPEPGWRAGSSVPSAITLPSQHSLGSAIVDTKTHEIPVARQLYQKLDLDGRKVSLEALHTQAQSACRLVLEQGPDHLPTVKDNQPPLRKNIQQLAEAPPAHFSPSGHGAHLGRPA